MSALTSNRQANLTPHTKRWGESLTRVRARIEVAQPWRASGRVMRATGLIIETVGLRVPLGGGCLIELPAPAGDEEPRFAEAEVVGFSDEKLFLMPLAGIAGLQPGARVFALGEGTRGSARRFPLGETLLGRVVDGNGEPLDGLGALDDAPYGHLVAAPLNPLARAPIEQQIDVGIRAINALLRVGVGQRMGLFAGSGVGKSVLAEALAEHLGRELFRVDGDERYTEQKMIGWFDPALVIKEGYRPEHFIEGPLLGAMRTGGILFVNEINRMPESVQNVLL
ncbi:MAG: AAA family ATPase, partial [Halochromatium sp.]